MRESGIIKQLLKKYDLMLPVLPGEQRKIYRSKRRTLAVILNKNVRNSIWTSAAVSFYYALRRMGITATVASGARTAVFASAMAVMVFAGGGVMLLQNYFYQQGMIAVNDISRKGILTVTGDLTINREGAGLTENKAPVFIKPGDVIITNEYSSLLQLDNKALVKIIRKSSVRVYSLGPLYRLDLNNGGIITGIPSLAAGSGFEIHTPDAVVSVRGTEFGVQYGSGKTSVYVKKGIVSVKYLPTGEEYDVAEGNSTEVNAGKKTIPMQRGESLNMERFSELVYIESAETRTSEELQGIKDKLNASDAVTGDLIQPKKMTLEEMKTRYGKLDEVMLYNGRIYTGIIISRGGVYKILTPAGVVSVPVKEVKGSRIIK